MAWYRSRTRMACSTHVQVSSGNSSSFESTNFLSHFCRMRPLVAFNRRCWRQTGLHGWAYDVMYSTIWLHFTPMDLWLMFFNRFLTKVWMKGFLPELLKLESVKNTKPLAAKVEELLQILKKVAWCTVKGGWRGDFWRSEQEGVSWHAWELLDEREIFKYFINGKHLVSCLDAGTRAKASFL